MDIFKIIIILGFVLLLVLWIFDLKSRKLLIQDKEKEQGEVDVHMDIMKAVENLESLRSEGEIECISYPTAGSNFPEGLDEITKRFINDFGTVYSVYGDTTIGAKFLESHLVGGGRIKIGESLADGLEYFLDEIGRSEVISVNRENPDCILDRFPTIFHLVATVCDV